MKTIFTKNVLILIIIVLGLLVFAACSSGNNEDIDQNDNLETGEEDITENYIYCPLDHTIIDEEIDHPPIMVSIDNLPSARPQSGLDKADIIYEIPAEGGVSRFLAVFYHGTADEIGPVRSARPYFVDLARERNAVFVHAGGSQDALNYLASGVINSINEFAYGSFFWRDNSRSMPHNLYTSSEKLMAVLEKKGWDQETEVSAFKFITEDEEKDTISVGVEVLTVEIDYPSAHDIYKYDNEKGLYLRYIKDNPHCDRITGEQLTASNIIVQHVTSKVLDSEGRLAIDMTGEGEALLFSQGHVMQGKWQRDDLDSRTVFYDDSGEEWILAPGQTWIQIADQNVKITY